VVRDAPVSIVVIDASRKVIYSNGRARELTSRQLGREMPADLDDVIDIFHPDGRRYERHARPTPLSSARVDDSVAEGEEDGLEVGVDVVVMTLGQLLYGRVVGLSGTVSARQLSRVSGGSIGKADELDRTSRHKDRPQAHVSC
jgi:PAS domain-containing protein